MEQLSSSIYIGKCIVTQAIKVIYICIVVESQLANSSNKNIDYIVKNNT
jgi:hypothetical protein